MTPGQRRWIFLAGAAGLAAFYLWGLTGLPGFGHYPGRTATSSSVAIATSAVVAGLLVVIMIRVAHHDETYWFGGFRPHHGIAIGVDFEVGPLSAALAALAAVLVTAAMVFSWRYFERIATYYHVLMLAFLAGMTGFCLTGDVFDMFVWFELLSVAAYALPPTGPRNAARSRAR
jgi:multicomponent Na+:H+ antiporter subunit D